jgi:NADH-quinone oxidoreductase subunit I
MGKPGPAATPGESGIGQLDPRSGASGLENIGAVCDDEGMRLPGSGLVSGLAATARTATRRAVTSQYPENEPELPDRTRGVIALHEPSCTSCMLCARECPDWCIYIDSHKETVEVEGAARPRQVNVLDRFDIDFSLCMYCGICVDVCPFDALFWAPDFAYAEGDIRDLLHDKEHLGEWIATVPESAKTEAVKADTE